MAFSENLKDVIISTLSEVEQDIKTSKLNNAIKLNTNKKKHLQKAKYKSDESKKKQLIPIIESNLSGKPIDRRGNEKKFLSNMKEKMIVLFEGLQSENLQNTNDKMDLVLNYLEYTLSDIEQRLEKL